LDDNLPRFSVGAADEREEDGATAWEQLRTFGDLIWLELHELLRFSAFRRDAPDPGDAL
jgi:hypothetical protein